MSQITIQNLYFTYDGDHTPVFEDLNLQLDTNWKLGLVGRNGRGKTTLLRLLLGLEQPDGGSIRGADCRWAAVFQEDRLLEDLPAAGNLRFALGKVPEDAGTLLSRLGLDLSDPKNVRTWSGGMKRRLALARALLAPAEALALDEPFAGLDGENRDRCLAAIRERGGGRPVLLATHDLTGLEDAPVVRLRGV